MSNADQYTLETPENIEVDFELAGLGSRFCAMLIDTMVLGVIVLALCFWGSSSDLPCPVVSEITFALPA